MYKKNVLSDNEYTFLRIFKAKKYFMWRLVTSTSYKQVKNCMLSVANVVRSFYAEVF